jgi:BirA family biotin operon repressor/biotin-[acetyl-CoA-carboxylase] ligase
VNAAARTSLAVDAADVERRHRWDADRLQRTLGALAPGLQVEIVDATGSTNADLLADRKPPRLRVAERQRQGRGRRGKAWHSSPDAGIGVALTGSLSRVTDPVDWSGLSLAIGCALAEALDPQGPSRHAPRIGLKWPNDLWLIDPSAPGGGRKLGGILIETTQPPEGYGPGRTCVIGVGINLHRRNIGEPLQPVQPVNPVNPDGAFANGIAWLEELEPTVNDLRAPTLARVAHAVLQTLDRFENSGLSPFLESFSERDLLRGRRIQTEGAVALRGVGDGIDAGGGLRLRCDDSRVETIHSGEVSIRPLGDDGMPEALPC